MPAACITSLRLRSVVVPVVDAERFVAQVVQGGNTAVFAHKDALAVIKNDGCEGEPVAASRIAAQGVGGVAGEDVDLATSQRGKALAGREGNELHFLGIAQHHGCNGAADIGVNAGGSTLGTGGAETR